MIDNMKYIERNVAAIIVIVLTTVILLSSCASSGYYKGCDGKKKFKTQMN
tara:strand:+ start:759 stop:908 length:150 start_codon:yes stop_codon:yes gene_type:complete